MFLYRTFGFIAFLFSHARGLKFLARTPLLNVSCQIYMLVHILYVHTYLLLLHLEKYPSNLFH